MSGLIKAGGSAATGEIRRFALSVPPAPERPSREAVLEQKIAELEAAAEAAAEKHERELEQAAAEAASNALEQRSDAEERAIAALRAAAETANGEWKKRLERWDAAAAAIARAVLLKLLSDADERSALVEECIRHRVALIGSESVVRLRVSAEDFPEPARLRGVVSGSTEIVADAALGGGGCIVDLSLGHVDLGLDAQCARVAELLGRLEGEEAAC